MSTALVTRTGTIYMLTSPSGKAYIGQTRRTIRERIDAHLYQSGCVAIHAALNKYGLEAFKVELLLTGIPVSQLNWFEGLCVALFGTLSPNGYNLGPGGNAAVAMSEEARRKLSDSMKRLYETDPLARDRRSKAAILGFSRPGIREKLSRAAQKYLAHPEARQRRSEAAREYNKNPEVRLRKKKEAAATWSDPEIRERRIAGLKAALATPEGKAQRLAAMNTPETAAKRKEASKRYWSDPAAREAQRVRTLAFYARRKQEAS